MSLRPSLASRRKHSRNRRAGQAIDDELTAADIVVLAAPHTPATETLLDARRLDCLPPGAIVVNVARGALLDEDALAERVRDGRLQGAVLDVFREEPLPAASPLWGLPSVLVGAAVFALWVGVELWLDYPHLGSRVGYNPFDALSPANARAFLAVRLYGLILLVPVFEELLWRSFLIRYATTTADFRTIPPWAYSMTAFWIVAIAAAVSHTEWLVAFAANAIYLLWMRRTRSLFAVVVAHATTNAMLGVFILMTGYWIFW